MLDRVSVPLPIAVDILMDTMASISISVTIGDGTEARSRIV